MSSARQLPQNIARQAESCSYWRQMCHGLDLDGVRDRAAGLTYAGFFFGPTRRPTQFLCLLHKLLQLHPTEDFLRLCIGSDHRYTAVLGAAAFRVAFADARSYTAVEPLYARYERIIVRGGISVQQRTIQPQISAALIGAAAKQAVADDAHQLEGPAWGLTTVDQVAETLLNDDSLWGMALPPLLPRNQVAEPYFSPLEKNEVSK